MRIEILGPARVIGDDGRQSTLNQPRTRQLLCVLSLRANQAVVSDEIASMMWDAPPDGCRAAIRTHVWALRKALGPGQCVRKDPAGYRLEIPSGDLDLDEFRRYADQGRKALDDSDCARAEVVLATAVSLWRDPPLADLPVSRRAEAVAHGLMAEFRAASDALADARLKLGRFHDVATERRARVAVEPFHEKAWEQLMQALYLEGRRTEALNTYMQAYDSLNSEYGISPGPGLRHLHARILAEDGAACPDLWRKLADSSRRPARGAGCRWPISGKRDTSPAPPKVVRMAATRAGVPG